MTNLVRGLSALGFTPVTDFVVQDDGEGPYLKAWLSSTPQPSDAAIEAAAQKAAQAVLQAQFSAAIEHCLNAKAAERRYDSITTATSYRDDPNPQYAAEGQALFAWRSAVWTYAVAQLEAVKSGTREQPSIETFLAEIDQNCPFAWPG